MLHIAEEIDSSDKDRRMFSSRNKRISTGRSFLLSNADFRLCPDAKRTVSGMF